MVVSDVRIKRRINFDITTLQDNLSHRGIRHKLQLPFMANVLELMHQHSEVNEFEFVFFRVLIKIIMLKNNNFL